MADASFRRRRRESNRGGLRSVERGPCAEEQEFRHASHSSARERRIQPRTVSADAVPPATSRKRSFSRSLSPSDESPPQSTLAQQDVEKPNFNPSGLLVKETNEKSGVVLKHCEPPESHLPTEKWRFYVFKRGPAEPSEQDSYGLRDKNASISGKPSNAGNSKKPTDPDQPIKIFHLYHQASYLIGREIIVAEIPLVHPSVSKQHAVVQFRNVNNLVRPYIIDLESSNGTFLNGLRIESARYYELRMGDVLKFGASTREFVLLNASEVVTRDLDYEDFVEKMLEARRKKRAAAAAAAAGTTRRR